MRDEKIDISSLLEARKVLTDTVATANVRYSHYEERNNKLQNEIAKIDALIEKLVQATP